MIMKTMKAMIRKSKIRCMKNTIADGNLLLHELARVIGHALLKHNSEAGEVYPAQREANRWHNDISRERLDNGPECTRNDYGYGQFQYVAFHDEGLEFF